MTALTPQVLARIQDDQIDAFIEVMLWAASADGDLDPSEVALLKKSLMDVDDLWLSHIELEARLNRLHDELADAKRPDRLAAVKVTLGDPEMRLAGLELAVRVTAADGVLRTSERELILETAEALDIDPDAAANVVKKLGH